jgi:DNA processing protein
MSTTFMQIAQINLQDSAYPDALRHISAPPKQLFLLGVLPKEVMVAMVGTRSMTDYGRQTTYDIAYELAQAGVVIVSGLAYGVDAIAHRAAIDAGGKTVAVLARGLDAMYPASHRNLAIDILRSGGALLSEYEVKVPPLKHHFIARNRIVTGLCRGTVITESSAQGGAMHSANFTINEGRILMAVPGSIHEPRSAGTNNLLREGACTVTSATDVLNVLGLGATLTPGILQASSAHEARILERLQAGPCKTPQLLAATGLSAAEFASIISLMEITGRVRNLGGKGWAKRTPGIYATIAK